MKKFFRAYTSFSRAERMGVIALCCLLIGLIIVRMTMHLWVHGTTDTEKEKKLAAEWEAFKRASVKTDTAENGDTVSVPVKTMRAKRAGVDTVVTKKVIRYKEQPQGE